MSWRLYWVVAGLAVIALFSGCATRPPTSGVVPDEVEQITGPSTLIAGARVDEVRSVAMGAARSKGWTIVSASDQKLVLTRAVNPDAPQVVELGVGPAGSPPSVEVTSLFRQVPGGVNVTLNAQLVAKFQGQGKDAGGPLERRIDYTESYRDNLIRSLESLRETWAAHRGRVARALPPINTAGQAAAETAAELKADDAMATGAGEDRALQSPLSAAPGLTAWGEGNPGDDYQYHPPTTVAPPAAEPTPEPALPQPKPQVAAPTKALPAAAPTAQAAGSAKPKPAPAGQIAGPAKPKAPPAAQVAAPAKPKVPAASQAAAKSTTAFPTPVRAVKPQTKPPTTPAPVPKASNMMALDRAPTARSEIGNAERYASQRGCRVRSGRTQVFKRDGAAQYMRVYCAGDPAFVVKCGNGACKVLE